MGMSNDVGTQGLLFAGGDKNLKRIGDTLSSLFFHYTFYIYIIFPIYLLESY